MLSAVIPRVSGIKIEYFAWFDYSFVKEVFRFSQLHSSLLYPESSNELITREYSFRFLLQNRTDCIPARTIGQLKDQPPVPHSGIYFYECRHCF